MWMDRTESEGATMSCARRAWLAGITALALLGATASAAQAASMTTDCVGLQAALDQAVSGDAITLNQLCTVSNSGPSAGSFTLNVGGNDSRSYTIQGQPGTGAGFDGTGVGARILSANNNGSSPTATLTVSNLVFQNGGGPGSGGAVAFQGDYAVTLSGDTFANNLAPGGGSGGAVDVETQAASAAVTLSNDTFTGNRTGSGPGPSSGGAVNIATGGAADTITLSADTFTNNTTAGGAQGGAVELLPAGAGQSLNVTNSTFRGNTTQSGGGAMEVFVTGAAMSVTLTANTFANNAVNGCGAGCELDGGALSILDVGLGTSPVTQTANTFTGNSITGATQDVNGGAESIIGATLNSTDDSFTGNSLQAPVSGHVSKGSALGIENDCTAANPQDVASNLAVAGNSITDGGDTTGANGALSVSCAFGSPGNPNSLRLNDSTISGNRGGGGTTGIWGEPGDQLTLQNSIVTGNSDGTAELTGFTGTGGSVTATYTDLCNGTSPFTGNGNICAPPALAGAPAGNVHETYSSPTVDAGSNALVPNGLTTDVYGANRIQPRLAGRTATVDMGAAELPSVPAPSASITTPASGATYAFGQMVASNFSCSEGSGGPGISSCLDQSGHASGGSVDTSTAGTHTLTVTATSSDGLMGSASVNYTVSPAPTAPTAPTVSIAAPVSGARYAFEQTVPASFGCQEGTGGPGLSSCLGTVANGSPIDTSTPGSYMFNVTATSSDGQVTTQSILYTVLPPGNHFVKPPKLKPHSDGRFFVTVKVPHPGRVDILVTAWKDNFATAAAIRPPAPVLLQPAIGRFVFARAHALANRASTLRILITPNARGRTLVAKHRYRVTLRLWVSYTPTQGRTRTIGYYGLHLP
jgi:hypothetical protein